MAEMANVEFFELGGGTIRAVTKTSSGQEHVVLLRVAPSGSYAQPSDAAKSNQPTKLANESK